MSPITSWIPLCTAEVYQCSSDVVVLDTAVALPGIRTIELRDTLFEQGMLAEIADKNPTIYIYGWNNLKPVEFNPKYRYRLPTGLDY